MASASSRGEKVDVALFYHDTDENKANELRGALKKHGLTVKSCNEFPVGTYGIGNRAGLIEHSWCVVLIVTESFVADESNKFETYTSLQHSIDECKRKVIPVKHSKKVPVALSVFVGPKGSDPLDTQATRILKAVESLKKESEEREIAIKEYETQTRLILDHAMDLLKQQNDVDGKTNELHQTMKEEVEKKIGNDPNPDIRCDTGCSCLRGKIWKEEISQRKYWAVAEPEPFRNIDKFKTDQANKHTADIHQLYGPGGYIKLALLFLAEQPMPTEDLSKIPNLCAYLDQDGLLQLLQRCSVFNIPEEKRASIEKVRDARNKLAHIPEELKTGEEQENFFADIVDNVGKGCNDLLSSENWKSLLQRIEEVMPAKVTATVDQRQSPDEGVLNKALRGLMDLKL